MISQRTWVLLAATVIAFGVCVWYWNERPAAYKLEGGVTWDFSELGPTPYDQWIVVGEISSAAFVLSLLGDFVVMRRKSK